MRRPARLTLPNEMEALPPLQAFVAEAARSRGFAGKALGEIEVALEEAVTNVLDHAYEEGEEAAFDVTVESVPLGLALTVADRGIPYAPEAVAAYGAPRDIDEASSRGLGLFLMRNLMDEVSFRNLGPEGKETRLVKYLPDRSVADEASLSPRKEGRPSPASGEGRHEGPLAWSIRPMRPEEAIEVARCAYEAYGYSYPNSHLYYPERVVELNRNGDIASFVAVSDGDILAHCALEITAGADDVELGMAFVKPRYRGRGLLKEMTIHLTEEARRRGYGSAFVQSVTTHEASQKAALSWGFLHSALLVGFFAPSMDFRKLAGASCQRLTLAYQHLPLDAQEAYAVHLPPRHRAFMAELYDSLGLERTFAPPAAGQREGPGRMTADLADAINAAVIDVEEAASGTEAHLHHLVRQFCLRRTDAVLVRLNLEDPATPALTESLERRGFFFCGILPRRQGDRLALIYLNNCSVDFGTVAVAGERGQRLADYIRPLAEDREEA